MKKRKGRNATERGGCFSPCCGRIESVCLWVSWVEELGGRERKVYGERTGRGRQSKGLSLLLACLFFRLVRDVRTAAKPSHSSSRYPTNHCSVTRLRNNNTCPLFPLLLADEEPVPSVPRTRQLAESRIGRTGMHCRPPAFVAVLTVVRAVQSAQLIPSSAITPNITIGLCGYVVSQQRAHPPISHALRASSPGEKRMDMSPTPPDDARP